MRIIKKKSPEQIMKANLGKTLTKMKSKVADREELWLDVFTDLVPLMLGEGPSNSMEIMKAVEKARRVADMMLDAYEERWGKG